MINNDSIVTAYDEHLTLVEWLQKIEKLLANGGLKSTTLNDKGNATFSLTLTFNDNTAITSPDMTLTSVNEALTTLNNEVAGIKDGSTHLFETITDSHGNHRFVEGNLNLSKSFADLGVTILYGKWSLSGSHLMFVLALNIPSGVTLPTNTTIASATLPSYITDKLVGLWSTVLDIKNFDVRNSQSWYLNLLNLSNVKLIRPSSGNTIFIDATNSITTEVNSTCRIQFDLIIDNE